MKIAPVCLGGLALGFGVLFANCQAPQSESSLPADALLLGLGEHTYRWDSGWLQFPAEGELGNTHGGFAFDAAGNIIFSTDAAHAVIIARPDGTILRSFGEELAGGVHSVCLANRDGVETLFLPHHATSRVLEYSMEGELLREFGVPTESGHYEDPSRYRPTAVAVRPDGSFFVADGYGLSWIHRYDAEGNYLASFGGRGSEPGQFVTPHGLYWDEELRLLVVADRENHRLQFVHEDGSVERVLEGMFRRPCSVQRRGEDYVVADLAGRVTIVSVDGQRIFQLGDQVDPGLRAKNGIPREQWADGMFLSPHGAGWDQNGNLYVQDWNFLGRVTRLERVNGL